MNKSLLDFKLYPTWDKNEDELGYLQYKNLFFLDNDGYSREFHAGKEYCDWSDVENVFGMNYPNDIVIYQGDYYDKYEEFGKLNLLKFYFHINRPKKTSSTPSIKNKDNPIKWNKLICSKYRVNKLPNGKFEILYY